MKSQSNLYVVLVTLIIGLTACGGGGGGGQSNNDNFYTSSSQSPTTPSVPLILAADNQTFTLDEDNSFNGEIKLLTNNVSAMGNSQTSQNNTNIITSTNGGLIKLIPSNDNKNPRLYFSYDPPEDFNGADEAFIYLSTYNPEKMEGSEQRIKILLKVNPVADEGFKFKINNKKVFSAGDHVQLSSPYFPDAQEMLKAGSNLKLFVDAIPLTYTITNEGISTTLPSQLAAGVNQLNMEIEYQGKTLSANRSLTSKIDYGDVEYWMGDKGRAGVTYVVFAENTVDKKRYLDWITKEFTELLSKPIVAQYSSYWNLAVIKEPSPENYAFLSTGESRALISDLKTTGEAYVRKFVPNADWIILNSSLDGRATGGYPMTINFSPINLIMHEFGHVHGKLADEYADQTVTSNPNYIEGSNPNVTLFNDYESIPWKHWILDKAQIPNSATDAGLDSVGAFLGAFYTDSKFYRPTRNSLMRSTDAPLGSVNSEAWVLATYERLGLLASVTSTKDSNVRHLTIGKPWNKNLTRVDWFLDDVKQDVWANKSSIEIDESTINTLTYNVKAQLTDLSGYIKNPDAYASFNSVAFGELLTPGWNDKKNESFQKSWIFEKTISTKLQKIQSSDGLGLAAVKDYWTSHVFSIRNGQHQLVSTSSYSALDTLIPVTVHSELRADILDTSGAKLFSVGVDHPYYHYHEDIGLVSLKNTGAYKIKHPYVNGHYQINIVDLHTGQIVTSFLLNQAKY